MSDVVGVQSGDAVVVLAEPSFEVLNGPSDATGTVLAQYHGDRRNPARRNRDGTFDVWIGGWTPLLNPHIAASYEAGPPSGHVAEAMAAFLAGLADLERQRQGREDSDG